MANENAAKQGSGNRMDNNANATGQAGARIEQKGSSSYLGLPARDRNAIINSGRERFPEEYGGQIEQYLKNLSDQGNKNEPK
jgi:hypothetical protein